MVKTTMAIVVETMKPKRRWTRPSTNGTNSRAVRKPTRGREGTGPIRGTQPAPPL